MRSTVLNSNVEMHTKEPKVFKTFELSLDKKENWTHFAFDGPKDLNNFRNSFEPFEFVSVVVIEIGLANFEDPSKGGHMSGLIYTKPATIDIGKIWFE